MTSLFPTAPKSFSDVLKANPGMRPTFMGVAQGGVYLRPTAVQTVLGSCLAACFYVPERNIGAIFHAFLPRCADFDSCFPPEPFKYVDTAITSVLKTLERLSVNAGDIQVKLVGGASALVDVHTGIGRKNVAVAREILAGKGLKVLRSDVGGPVGRKILYLTGTGQLFITSMKGISS